MDHIEHRPEPASGTWFVTFTDVVCLLLTFFVMLYAMSSVAGARWDAVTAALSQQAAATDAPVTNAPTAQYNIATVFRKRAINLDYLQAVLRDVMARDERLKTAHLNLLDDRLVISLPGDLLFAPSSAVVEARAEKALFALGGVLGNLTNPVAVVGHSDPSAPSGSAYTSNWELTVGRAAAVANVLKRSGYTREVTALGAAESRFGDLDDVAPERRAALARRVDVVVLAGGG
jgi:chemotaxis protein MotB